MGSHRRHHAHAAARRGRAVVTGTRLAAIREFLSRLLGTFRARRSDRDLEDELRTHLELAADEAQRRGEGPDRRHGRHRRRGRRHPRRRPRPGDGSRPRSAPPALAGRSRARRPARPSPARPQPHLHRGCRRVAGARHRRQRGRVQLRRHAAAAAASGASGGRRADDRIGRRRPRRSRRLLSGIRGHPRSLAVVQRRDRVHDLQRRVRRRRVGGAAAERRHARAAATCSRRWA